MFNFQAIGALHAPEGGSAMGFIIWILSSNYDAVINLIR